MNEVNILKVGKSCTCSSIFKITSTIIQWSPTFWAPGISFMEDNFFHRLGAGEWSQDDSSILHLVCILLLLLLHQLYLRLSGVISQRLETPAIIEQCIKLCESQE